MATKIKPKVKKIKKRLSPQEKATRREQSQQRKEISIILKNIVFSRLPYIDGKHFEFEGIKTEMDDIFIYENVILITEYTIGDPGTHLKYKSHFYNKIAQDRRAFLDFR